MAANLFQFADWVTLEAVRQLTNSLELGQYCNTDLNDEFDKEYPIGATLRVKLPFYGSTVDGLGYNPQAIARDYATVTMDQIVQYPFEWDSVEAYLQAERGRERFNAEYLTPAIAQIKQDIESRLALFAYQHTNNIVGSLGTNPTSLDVFNEARQVMVEKAGITQGPVGVCIAPSINTSLVGTGRGLFNPTSEISRQWQTGVIGSYAGATWHESVSLYSHTAGTWQTPASVTVKGAGQSGTSLLVNCTSGDTFKKGDVIGIASVYPVNPRTRRKTQTAKTMTVVVQADVTASTTSATLSVLPAIYGPEAPAKQTVDALPGNAALLTLFPGTSAPNGKSGLNSLVMNKGAFAIVGAKLENPKAVEMSSQTRDPDTGISIAFVRMFDPQQRKMINRFDALFGFGAIRPNNCAVRVLGA